MSAALIASIAAASTASSSPSSYNTTSGLIVPPHSHCGMPLQDVIKEIS